MDVEVNKRLEKRVIKLEKALEVEGKIGRFERYSVRIGALILFLLTLLAFIVAKLIDLIELLRSTQHF